MRGTPSFLGQVVTGVSYGQSVEKLGAQGPWVQVRTAEGKAGWMHESALTAKRIAAGTGGASARSGASGDELALAGKGFNADVEAQFKAVARALRAAVAWDPRVSGVPSEKGTLSE